MLRSSCLIWLRTVVAVVVLSTTPTTAQSVQDFERAADSIRSSIERGHYAEAEENAQGLFRSARDTNNDTPFVVAAGDLLVQALVRNGRGSEVRTRQLADEMVRGRPTTAGLDHPFAASLRNLGEVLYQAGDYRQAVTRLTEALAIRERSQDADVSALADDLDRLARALTEIDRNDEALGYSDRALELRNGRVDDRAGLARTLQIRGLLWQNKGDRSRARADLERAAALHEAVHPHHPETAIALAYLGEQYRREGALSQARQVLARASALAESTLRPDHPDVAFCLNRLALALQDLGDIAGTKSLRERTLAIAEKSLGADHPQFADQLNDLANTLLLQGEYSSARTLYERARNTYERRLGPDHNNVTTASYNLALLHSRLGDLREARREFQRVIETWTRVNGPEHPNVGRALSAFGDALGAQGLDREAQMFYQRALTIRERALGADHPLVARTLLNFADSLARTGQVSRALELSARSLRISERTGAQGVIAAALLEHAQILVRAGDRGSAARLYERALETNLLLLGPSHPSVAETEVAFAGVLASLGSREKALTSALRGEEVGRRHLQLTLSSLAERQALEYAAKRPKGLSLAISLLANGQEATPVLDALILGRSLTLDEIAFRQRSFADSTTLAPLWAALTSARQRLANLVIRGPGAQQPTQYAGLVDEARREKEAAERALAERSATFRSQLARAEIGIGQVRDVLPPNAALVSFVRYERTLLNETPASRSQRTVPSYVAFVLRPGVTDPAVVQLGPADAIESLIARWRTDVSAGIARPVATPTETEKAFRGLSATLRQRIWDPVAAHLKNVNRVFVVPDGAINLVPLVALPSGQSRYLLEDGPAIHYLSAERDLVPAERQFRNVTGGLLAVGGPAFADGTVFAALAKPGNVAAPQRPEGTAAAVSFRGAGSQCSTFQSMQFSALPGSGREVEEVAGLWRDLDAAALDAGSVRTLTGREASEAAVKRLGPGRRILHLATHGFFLEDQCQSAIEGTRAVGGLVPSGPGANASRTRRTRLEEPSENPLVLAGLALAGANRRAAASPDEDDGILTAEEVASLNLEGVEWAVLSACDTGLGQLRAGEGVFGLRRAFQVAGARTIIMSLWSVDDQAARRWMRSLYEGRLTQRLDTADAVRDASLSVLRERRAKGQSTHPFYWAGFVASGDWR